MVEWKLRQRKGITPEQVRGAVAYGGHDEAHWNEDPEYGRRLVLTGQAMEDTCGCF
jgi:hypothetical protein